MNNGTKAQIPEITLAAKAPSMATSFYGHKSRPPHPFTETADLESVFTLIRYIRIHKEDLPWF